MSISGLPRLHVDLVDTVELKRSFSEEVPNMADFNRKIANLYPLCVKSHKTTEALIKAAELVSDSKFYVDIVDLIDVQTNEVVATYWLYWSRVMLAIGLTDGVGRGLPSQAAKDCLTLTKKALNCPNCYGIGCALCRFKGEYDCE